LNYRYTVSPQSKDSIDSIAENYLHSEHPEVLQKARALDVEKFLDVSLVKTHDITIEIVESIDENTEAITSLLEKKIQVPVRTYEKIRKGDRRARFTVCHEGMHVILHIPQVLTILVGLLRAARASSLGIGAITSNIPGKAFLDPEWQANYGASALLMPRRTFIPFCEERIQDGIPYHYIIQDIMDVYQVSLAAAEKRFKNLWESLLYKQKRL